MSQIIGQYEVIEQIGAGGMATVYKAHQPKLDRFVAIKLMHQTFMQDSNFTARFEREARIVARLDHPNIVPVYDYDTKDGQPYLVMKYIEGRTLKDFMQEKPLTLEEVRHVMSSICDALSYAHRQDVLHRDMKPSNIIIDTDGVPYLTDFGLARIAQQGESTLSVDTTLGTPYYMSPEQAQGLSDLDARTDVYSVGIILYEMLVGRVPFTGDTTYAIIHKQIYAAPPRPTELNEELPIQVENVLLKALEKEPGKRYNTPNDLMRAFENALAETNMHELDMTRAEKAAQIAPNLQQFTPGGRRYASLRLSADGRRQVIVPILEDPSHPHMDLGDWVQLFVDRIRMAIEDMRNQFRDRGFRSRFEDAVYDIKEDVQRVIPSSQQRHRTGGIPSPVPPEVQQHSPARESFAPPIASPIAPQIAPPPRLSSPRHVVQISNEWGMDEASIRRRAQQRINQRRGFMIHLLVYVLIIFMLLGVQNGSSIAIREFFASPEFITEVGADGQAIGQALMPLADLPWAVVLAVVWGGGLVSHGLNVFYNSGRRLTRKRDRIRQEMVEYYGSDWQNTVSDVDYQRVRRSVENRSKRVVGLLTHLVTAIAITTAIFMVWDVVLSLLPI